MDKKLFEDLFDKVPNKGNLVIFGACKTGENIFKDLAIYKPETKVLGFIDNMQKGTFNNLPIWTLKEFIDKNLQCDLVIMSTQTDRERIFNIFDVYNIPVLEQTAYVSDHYRNNAKILNKENFDKIVNLFNNDDDKKLFEMIFKIRTNLLDVSLLEDYHLNKAKNKYQTRYLIRNQYLDRINKNAVKVIIDAGLNDGLNVIAYKKLLPHLQKVYGFEAVYDVVKKKYIEDFILDDKLEIVPYALGDLNKQINFYINRNNLGASFAEEITSKKVFLSPNLEHRIVEVVSLDKYCEKYHVKPDLIKMDIEGAEMSALRGGMEVINKNRPQLAISIYHSPEDFINIPIYLSEHLKNYKFRLGHYSPRPSETILYAIPNELA